MESWFLINGTPNVQGTYRDRYIIVEPLIGSRDRSGDFLLAGESNAAGQRASRRDTLQASVLLRVRFLRIILIANLRPLITGSFLFRSPTRRFRETRLIAMTIALRVRWRRSAESGKVHLAIVFIRRAPIPL